MNDHLTAVEMFACWPELWEGVVCEQVTWVSHPQSKVPDTLGVLQKADLDPG